MKHFVRSTCVVLSLFSVPALSEPTRAPAAPQSSQEERITLRVGRTKILKVPGLSRVALGDRSIADVKTEGENAVRLQGMSEGKTTLLVWAGGSHQAYVITVEK
jgi:pilus assembly protein CpaC